MPKSTSTTSSVPVPPEPTAGAPPILLPSCSVEPPVSSCVRDPGWDTVAGGRALRLAFHPGAPEVCGDGLDQDCDGVDRPCGPVGTDFGTQFAGWFGMGAAVGVGRLDDDGMGDLAVGAAIFRGGRADRLAPDVA